MTRRRRRPLRLRRAGGRGGSGGEGPINLVPLVDILTSIVFFSLLTYSGSALAALTSFDLALAPSVISRPDELRTVKEEQLLELLLTVRVNDDHLLLEHSANGGMRERIEGPGALDTLEARLVTLKRQFPQNRDLLVIPADGIGYEFLVDVLTRARKARYSGVSLGTRARKPDSERPGGTR